jgi:small-conductance mechanosensitive channel
MKRYWFKAKHYGWGWYPATIEGWVILLLYLIYVINRAVLVRAMFDTNTSFIFRYTFEFLLPTLILIIICYATGEKPEWRWGNKKKKHH